LTMHQMEEWVSPSGLFALAV
jgi:hypothetical protein